MKACRDELALRATDLEGGLSVGIRESGELRGVAQLACESGRWELEKLFVDPPAMGHGIGRRLFAWAAATVAARGGGKLGNSVRPPTAGLLPPVGGGGGRHRGLAAVPGGEPPRPWLPVAPRGVKAPRAP
ncbi:MAG: GNAT family N-acetyltransferase, partial [Erythrobacter sp.]